MSGLQNFIKRNLVAIVAIPGIIGIHWGWSVMQSNRALVSEEEQIDLPVVTMSKYLWRRVTGNSNAEGVETTTSKAIATPGR